jgi:cell division ATPase FtsA
LASPIFATAVGLLKHTIDNFGDKVGYVEEFKKITEEPTFRSQADESRVSQPKNEQRDDDSSEQDDDEAPTENGKKKGLFNKLFSLTKDFFETVPDSEF